MLMYVFQDMINEVKRKKFKSCLQVSPGCNNTYFLQHYVVAFTSFCMTCLLKKANDLNEIYNPFRSNQVGVVTSR